MIERTVRAPFIHLWGAAQRELGFDFTRYRPIEGTYMALLYDKYLEPSILARLEPVPEASFRTFVQKHVRENWDVEYDLIDA